ncbi:MAG: hypothetical protein WC397_01755 [Candidatus Paceibacterota bacterium]|jgi:hypothetical protein
MEKEKNFLCLLLSFLREYIIILLLRAKAVLITGSILFLAGLLFLLKAADKAYEKLCHEIRAWFMFYLKKSGQLDKFCARVEHTAIYITGDAPSLIDKEISKKDGLKPLNSIEKWMVAPFIGYERKRRQYSWKNATKDL